MDQEPTSKKREIISALAVLIVIVAIVASVTFANKKKTEDTTNTTTTADTTTSKMPDTADTTTTTDQTSTSDTSSSSSSTTTTSTYKDGTYTATGSYSSPGGQEQITVSVTLANDVVTATSAKSGATDPEAREYQSEFISAYKQQVVGKSIASLHLSRVSGSSLTSQGFNSAISTIKSKAHA